jgi:DHA1 family bicyclomycin/chloramphenicol resistance-like MFS transporter
MVFKWTEGAADRYKALLADRRFIGAALVSGMIVSAVFTYMTSSSFVFQGLYGLSAQEYSVVFAVNAVGFVIGSQTSSLLLRRIQPTRVLAVTLPLLTMLGLGTAASSIVSASPYPLTALTAAFFVFAGASGPCLGVIAMTPHGMRAGTAAAAMGAASFGLAGITAPLAGIVGGRSAMPTGLVMGLTMALATGLYWALIEPRRADAAARRQRRSRHMVRPGGELIEILHRPNSTFRDEVLDALHRA